MKCLSVHLTDLCNSECVFCVVGSPFFKVDSVRYDDVVRFLRANAAKGFSVVNFHGGEPTIHPRFLEVLRLVRDLKYPRIHLQTNAVKLADRSFALELIDLGVTKFIISLHGATAATQDSQTFTRDGFTRTIQGIRNVKGCQGLVRTNTVITKANIQELPDIATLACDLGVDHVNYSALHPVGSADAARASILPTFASVHEPLCAAIEIARSRGRRVTLEGFPHCVVSGQGRERLHLHNEYRGIRMLIRGQVKEDYDDWMRDELRTFGAPCESCNVRDVCGGVYPEYVQYYGWGEFSAVDFTVDDLRLRVANDH